MKTTEDAICRETFQDCIDDDFLIELDGQTITLRLVEVEPLPFLGTVPGAKTRSEPFSLVFATGDNRPLNQQTWNVCHARLGTIEIFLVPIAVGQYQAVFA